MHLLSTIYQKACTFSHHKKDIVRKKFPFVARSQHIFEKERIGESVCAPKKEWIVKNLSLAKENVVQRNWAAKRNILSQEHITQRASVLEERIAKNHSLSKREPLFQKSAPALFSKQRMGFLCLVFFLCMLFSGCSSLSSSARGSMPSLVQHSLAQEAFEGIQAQYPAALTIFSIRKEPKDIFGKKLLSLLRANGYGVVDLSLLEKRNDTLLSSPLLLGWEYNTIGQGSSFLFLRISVGKSLYTKAYYLQGGRLLPSGPWMQADRVF